MATPHVELERIAHRGMPRERTENTLAGFQLALERGASGIELDVHGTADGVVVVHHDPGLQGRSISATPWSALEELVLADGQTMPTLQAVLALVSDRAAMYVELKGAGIEAAVAALAGRHRGPIAVHSFDHAAITRLAALAPDLPRGVLLDRDTGDPAAALLAAVRRTGARDVWPHWTLVRPPLLRAAASAGVRVIPWTVNDETVARSLAAMGVHGICTDDVRILANLPAGRAV